MRRRSFFGFGSGKPFPGTSESRRSQRPGWLQAPLALAWTGLTLSLLAIPSCSPADGGGGDPEQRVTPAPSAPVEVGELSERVKGLVTVEDLLVQAEGIVRYERPSGSAGENAAIDHVVAALSAEGIPVRVHTFDAFVSDPVRAEVSVVGSDFAPPAITMAYSGSTEGLRAPLIDVGSLADLPALERGTGERVVVRGSELPAAGDPLASFPVVRGRIAMVTGQPRNVPTAVLERLGALGVIFVNPEERLNDLIVTSTWGSPSLQNYHRLPKIPVAQITRSAGDSLRALLERGRVNLLMSVEVDTGWKPLRLAVARINPPGEPTAPYVLFGGHIDAWYHGGTDEGASNAAMVSIAKAFHGERASLRRGLVVAWWPGHSNGRYAGSTWFADRFADEMRGRALAYVNVDGIGQQQATRYGAAASAALAPLATRVVLDGPGVAVRPSRPGTNSDQSFNGVGVPLLQLNHSRSQEDGGYWWWHTRDDTYDKIDFKILEADAHLYVDALSRLLADEVYPVDLLAQAAALGDAVAARGEEAQGRLDLSAVASGHLELTQAYGMLQAAMRPIAGLDRDLVGVIRPIHRVLYVARSPVHPDPGLGPRALPGLASASILGEERPDSDRYRFAETSLLRERSRIVEGIELSLERARRLTERLRATPQ